MNILASYHWLKEYIKTNLSPEEFAKEFSLRSMSVESIDDIGARCANIVVGDLLTIAQHPNADRLHVVTVNIGKKEVTIVCGGTNLVEGMRVAVALPGAKVFSGNGERREINLSTIRDVESAGMLCGPAEIGFDALQVGERSIWSLGSITDAPAGTPLADALGLDDVVFDVEITTNRPDAKGIVGLAREAGAAVNAKFSWEPTELSRGEGVSPISVIIDDKKGCRRQMAAVMSDVVIGSSPWWMQKRLVLNGLRPINAIVDITNYVMLEYGQPLHSFDLNVIEGDELHVRRGTSGEEILALNGKTYSLDGHLVIADAVRPLDIAGIMGGENSGIKKETTSLVLVASTFDAQSIRRTGRALDLSSDAQTLFEKGLSVEMPAIALARAIELIKEICGGIVVGEVIDERVAPYEPKIFSVDFEKIRSHIGIDISDAQMKKTLTDLGFSLEKSGKVFNVTVPYWREEDIEGEIDFTEEVARMYGYHNMPSVLPASRLPDGVDDASLVWEQWLKRVLAERGFVECFSNSLVSVADLQSYGISPKDALNVLNPLTADLTHLRSTLIPSMLRAIERNQALVPFAKTFEVSRVYIPREGDLPDERLMFLAGMYGIFDAEKTFMELRGLLEWIAARTGIAFTFERLDDENHWHAGRSVSVHSDGVRVGVLGQVSGDFQEAFGIHRPIFLAKIDVEALMPRMKLTHSYRPVPTFPSVRRDIAVLLDERSEFEKVHDVVCGSGALVSACDVVETYRGSEIPSGKKSVTLSVTMMAPDRTLTGEEVDALIATVTRELALRVGGIVRS